MKLFEKIKQWHIGLVIGLIIGIIAGYYFNIDGFESHGPRTILYGSTVLAILMLANTTFISYLSSFNTTIFIYVTAALPWILLFLFCSYLLTKWKQTKKGKYIAYLLAGLYIFIMASLIGFRYLTVGLG